MTAVWDTLRTRLLTYPVPGSGAKLEDILGVGAAARLYMVTPPGTLDPVNDYPFGVLRGYGWRTSEAHRNERMTGVVELTLFTRPRTEATIKALELAADYAQGALLRFKEGLTGTTTSGLIFVRAGTRDSLPPPTEPVDEESHTVRCTWDVVVWPRYLNQYASTLP